MEEEEQLSIEQIYWILKDRIPRLRVAEIIVLHDISRDALRELGYN